jgi:hypothetical protein
MELQKTPTSQTAILSKKSNAGGTEIPDFKSHYRTTVTKTG